jgi:outer membrane protein OmpA-like peptidoglycan-associated protein
MTARNAYAEARNGEAARLNPTGVHDAYKALQSAERAHDDDAGSAEERNYAYIATRKSELAVAAASEALARQEQQRADQTYKASLEQKSEEVAEQSSQYAEQLTQTQQALQERQQQVQAGQQKLQEVQASAAQAEQELRDMQALREERGRMVISLSGVLFESGKAELNPLAQTRLDLVANALAAYPDREIMIEGYTDAQGDEEKNRALSEARAIAVREYLESRGVPAQQLRAEGRGESSPIASNDTPEGRANNRRVEIVLTRPSGQEEQRSGKAPAGTDQERSRQPVSGTDSDTAEDPKQESPRQQQQPKPQPRQQPPQQ